MCYWTHQDRRRVLLIMSALPYGTYYLKNDSVGGCLTFPDNQSPPQVSTCDFNSQQQWEIQASSDVTYSVKNVAYNTYISPDQSSSALVQSSTPYGWYITLSAQNFIRVTTNRTATLGWYGHDDTNGSTVMLSTCCGAEANDWLYINAPNSNIPGPTPSPDPTWVTIAGVFISERDPAREHEDGQIENALAGYYPLLVGPSKKSVWGAVLEQGGVEGAYQGRKTSAQERGWATAAAVACAVQQGASAVRVHDVAETVRDVVTIASAIWNR
ncbi:hypothetical protein L210DRAFT_3760771 [Boletus edulis BED1]|uniref:Pterin-binding domain-containing protein n=1 Tax=Boletus edulis BED1 TaxID=1328754 RepID=A0AAD4BUG2_BOLED|nr:hypothetical protein L210DRAFT_3760771 [Boletus edulis BED1]